MRSAKIRKDRQKISSHGAHLQRWTVVLVLNRYGAQLCSCSIDTLHSCARAQSTRCPVSLVCNGIVLSRWCTVNFVLTSLVPTCSINGVCNRSGAHLYLCMTESCLIACTQSIRCTNDRCSIFTTDTVFSEYGAQSYLCAVEPYSIGCTQSTRCTVGWCTIVSTSSVSSRHSAQLFSCTIGPCPVGCAQSIPCTVMWCSIGIIPEPEPANSSNASLRVSVIWYFMFAKVDNYRRCNKIESNRSDNIII